MAKITNVIGAAYQQARTMSIMVSEANKVMKAYPKEVLKEALSNDDGITKLANEIYPQLSEAVRNSVIQERFVQVIVATRAGFLKNKKNKKILHNN